MTDQDYLQPAMAAWQKACLSGEIKEYGKGGHLTDDDFYPLAVPGGIDTAAEQIVDHIASCPVCLEKWAMWRRAVSDTAVNESEEEQIISYGMLRAAAGKEQKEAVNIKSNCGRFILGIYPQKDDPGKAMVVLEFVEGHALEGKKFVVRDNTGNILIDGSLQQGRVARVCEDFKKVDLSKWTLIEKDS